MSEQGQPTEDVTEEGATEEGATETPQNSQESADNSQRLAKLEDDFQQLSKIAENLKNDNAGKDRKINELIAENKELKLSQMSDDERKAELDKLRQSEIEQAKEEARRAKEEVAEINRKNLIISELSKFGLSAEKFSAFITAKEPEAISAQVQSLSAEIVNNAKEIKQKEINSMMAGGKPPADSSESSNLQTLYDQARKSNDTAKMFAIKRQAASQGIVVN